MWKPLETIGTTSSLDVAKGALGCPENVMNCAEAGPMKWFFHFRDESTPVVQWLSYSPLVSRFAGSIPGDFFRKGSKAVGPVS